VSLPQTITIDGVEYRAVPLADRVSSHVMYDCHLFRALKGRTVDELIADWQRETNAPDSNYGRPMLCPLIVMQGKTELRRVGPMVHELYSWQAMDGEAIRKQRDTLAKWREAALADPDISRILAARSTETVSATPGEPK
jgi:hypothetical protein